MLTDDYVPGAPNWLGLGSRDVEAAAPFYCDLFDWTFEPGGPGTDGNGTFQLDGRTVAGLGPLWDDAAGSAWTVYFHTEDADATTKAVVQAGGVVRFPPMAAFDRIRTAGYTDPTGGRFAVLEPGGKGDGHGKGLDRVGAGGLCWTELATTDVAGVRRFYDAVLSWDFEETPLPEEAGGGVYTVASPRGGGEQRTHAGIVQVGPDTLPAGAAYWQPYFSVADCDAVAARAAERGGSIVAPPATMPGVGRMALLRDREDAFFAILDPVPPAA